MELNVAGSLSARCRGQKTTNHSETKITEVKDPFFINRKAITPPTTLTRLKKSYNDE